MSLVKKFKVGSTIARYGWVAGTGYFFHRKQPLTQRKYAVQCTAKYSQILLQQLDIKTTCSYSSKISPSQNYFMVCNHMSYLDIIILSAIRSSVFITSVDMGQKFFLGDIAKIGGSFFVDRKNRKKIKEEVKALETLVEQGFDVFLFPEGTSSNGMQGVLPFKKSLFRVPFGAQVPLIPICLKYKTIDGKPFSLENCDQVTWHSKMPFAPHLNQLTRRKEVFVEVQYMDPVHPVDFETHGDLSQHIHSLISKKYEE